MATCECRRPWAKRRAQHRHGGRCARGGSREVADVDLLQLLGHGVDRLANLLFGVVRGDEEPQPGGLLFDGRMQDRLHVDAALEQRLRQLQAVHRVADDHRHDGRALGSVPVFRPRSRARLQEQLEHARASAPRAPARPRAVAARPSAAAALAGVMPPAEHEARGGVLQVLDQGLAAGDVAAAAAERLAERAHPDVDVGGRNVEMLADAAAVRAQHADRMGFVDVQEAPCAAS